MALYCCAPGPAGAQEFLRRVRVPVIRGGGDTSTAEIQLDLGARFDPGKPTVIVVEDGQQFYVHPGSMKALQADLFGPGVNVVGIIPRGVTAAFLDAAIEPWGQTNWRRAWAIFNSEEWIADIEAVRQSLVGARGQVDLYGRSGGAYLVHQYLAEHPTAVRRAFTQSAVDPALNRELHIPLDDYFTNIVASDSGLGAMLLASLPKSGESRLRALLTLQRQHFYVPADSLHRAQRELVAALATADSAALGRFERDYEVGQILTLERSREGIPQNVRVLELLYPSGAFGSRRPGNLYPLLESQAVFIAPLLDLVASGAIAVPVRDARQAHRVTADVFVLAAYNDEAVDYRTSIALANQYQSHVLFIANDNHVFAAMDRAGVRAPLVRKFLDGGPNSAAFREARARAAPMEWGADRTPAG